MFEPRPESSEEETLGNKKALWEEETTSAKALGSKSLGAFKEQQVWL